MGFFDKLQKPGKAALKQSETITRTEVRAEDITAKKTAFVHPIHSLNKSRSARPGYRGHTPTESSSRQKKDGQRDAQAKDRLKSERKRATASPLPQVWGRDEDGSDTSSDGGDNSGSRKKIRRTSMAEPDPERCIRDTTVYSNGSHDIPGLIHGADVAKSHDSKHFKAAFPDCNVQTSIELHYPSCQPPERFELVIPVLNDDFKSLEDIRVVIETVIDHYLRQDLVSSLTHESTGLLRRIKRAVDHLDGNEYKKLIQEWNDIVLRNLGDHTIERAIDAWPKVDLRLVERVLTQTYARTVSLRIKELLHYQNGTDDVYGELLPSFVSTILRSDTKMRSDQVFVDLGSGVGNCVLQAALEIGCESWGCERMTSACDLAEAQQKEFQARCRLWGLSPGKTHLERGNFLENTAIRQALARADVVLVNNQAFQAELNENLTNLFLDLKDGTKVISLKSFKPEEKSQSKNAGAVYNILETVKKEYYSNCVSWTDAHGSYFVSTKDSSRLSR